MWGHTTTTGCLARLITLTCPSHAWPTTCACTATHIPLFQRKNAIAMSCVHRAPHSIPAQVIPCPPNAKNPSSRGSSEQTGTQRTEPSAEYVPPSTRTATGSLPSRSRSSYSWGSDGQAPPGGHMGPDKLTRTSSNAANVRATQATPQVRGFEGYCYAGCPDMLFHTHMHTCTSEVVCC